MGTQNQTPNAQGRPPGARQPAKPGQDASRDAKPGRGTQAKDAGNVPRSDDDVGSDQDQGTREDGAGSNTRHS